MASKRDETLKALNDAVSPYLRERGFRGSLPHLRRVNGDRVDLLWVQFSKWGDGFTIELGSGGPGDLRGPDGQAVAIENAKSYHAPRRARLSAGSGTKRLGWFRYRSLFGLRHRSPQQLADDVGALLPAAERWWDGSRSENHIVPLD